MIKRWPFIEWLAPLTVIAFHARRASVSELATGGSFGRAGLHDQRHPRGELVQPSLLASASIVGASSWLWLDRGLGFLLKAVASFGLIAAQFTIHAFTVGGIGVLTIGMMARVSLGHTARPLKVRSSMAVAFALLNLAAVLRGLLPSLVPLWFSQLILASGILWIAAFLVFVIVYAPILTGPRIDGQPG